MTTRTPARPTLGARRAAYEGDNLHANVSFAASDRGGRERPPSVRVFLGFKRA